MDYDERELEAMRVPRVIRGRVRRTRELLGGDGKACKIDMARE